MSHSYKLTVQYDGTDFLGWQIQKEGRTIQKELNLCLTELAKSSEIRSLASGRTDTGVHALGQVVRVDLPIAIPAEGLKKGLNSLLPADIKIIDCSDCPSEFHPIAQSKSKTYHYYFTNGEIAPVLRNQITFVKWALSEEAIMLGAKALVGEHDFYALHVEGSDPESTVRTIYECDLIKPELGLLGDSFLESVYCLRIRGNGFLKQMVRMIVGSLWSLSWEKLTLAELETALAGQSRHKLGPVAPPQGLFLHCVEY